MKWFNDNSAGVQAIATLALVALTTFYATLTLALAKRSRDQVEVTRAAAKTQAAISMVQLLQANDVRDARRRVRSLTPTQRWRTEWSPEEQSAASAVCSSYDVAAMLLSYGFVDPDPLIANWGPSLVHCFDICKPFIHDVRQTYGRTYWANFERAVDLVPSDIREAVRAANTPESVAG